MLLAIPIAAAACDPGMTIRQTNTGGPSNQSVKVSVKTEKPLIGETWYSPDATVTNLTDAPITLAKVELIAGGTTYQNKPPGDSKYPLTIAAGETGTLPVWFDLKDDVERAFEKPVELRVYYRSGNKDFVSSAFMTGGPLETNAP
jgi:hypothetical protein